MRVAARDSVVVTDRVLDGLWVVAVRPLGQVSFVDLEKLKVVKLS